jgi:hypothetical protein
MPMFLAIPFLLKRGLAFPLVLILVLAGTGLLFMLYVWLLKRFGIELI